MANRSPEAPAHSPESSESVVVIGGGINGLIAANYLARAGVYVTLLEREPQVGGACVERKAEVEGNQISYPGAASLFGFMQKFVYKETGLAKRMKGKTHVPSYPVANIMQQQPELGLLIDNDDFRRAGEQKDLDAFDYDAGRVVKFLQKGFREGRVPDMNAAKRSLGKTLASRFLEGSARELAEHYATSEAARITMLPPANESGATSIDEKYSASSIPLMHSGGVFNGEWGFVRGGLWNLMHELGELNNEAGVRTITNARVQYADPDSGEITYNDADDNEKQLHADNIIFATDPVTAARLIHDKTLLESMEGKEFLGTAGKLVMFFTEPVVWKDYPERKDMFRYIFADNTVEAFEHSAQSVRDGRAFSPGYFEVYPEGAADRAMGVPRKDDLLSVYFKHLGLGKTGEELPEVQEYVARTVLNYIKNSSSLAHSVLLTPKDLQQQFLFPGGNIDHMELCKDQTLWSRTFSENPNMHYQFGNHSNVYYCGAGSYPCGSIAGTAGYMCVQNMLEKYKA